MAAMIEDFKKAALRYATDEDAVLDGDVFKFPNIDAGKAHVIAEALLAQGIIKEGETSGFKIKTLEMDSRTYTWRDETITERSFAKILELLPPRKGRPFDIEYDPASRELRIFKDVTNERTFMRALESSAAEKALPALADDQKNRDALKTAFHEIYESSLSHQNETQVAADAWTAVKNAGLENKLSHAQIQDSLRQIAWRSKTLKALL